MFVTSNQLYSTQLRLPIFDNTTWTNFKLRDKDIFSVHQSQYQMTKFLQPQLETC